MDKTTSYILLVAILVILSGCSNQPPSMAKHTVSTTSRPSMLSQIKHKTTITSTSPQKSVAEPTQSGSESCNNIDPHRSVDPQKLLPPAPPGWEFNKVLEFYMSILDGFTDIAVGSYTGPNGGEYYLSITQWPSHKAVKDEFTGQVTLNTSAIVGNYGFIVYGHLNETLAKQLLLGVECLDRDDFWNHT
ncbi:MAG: hypothetical protein ABEI06_06775 [Halobacteriaceae archaeon]